MTLLDAPPAPPAAPLPRRRRRARSLGVLLLVAALVAGVVVGGIALRDAILISQVHVFLDAEPLTCADPSDVTTVMRGDVGSAEGSYAVPSVRGVRSLDCTLSVVVRNDSDEDVAVQRLTLPLLGRGSAVGLRVDRSLTQGLAPSPAADPADVVFDYEHEAPLGVAAHGVEVVRIHLVSDGCRQAGATTTFEDAPIVTLATGLVTEDVDRQGVGFGFVGARTAAQPCV